MSDAARQAPVVSGSQVVSAGFAAAGAAFVTSRFGVAGTLLGAALTAMIITGGSAILKGYLETVTGNVRRAPGKLRTRKEQRKADRYGEKAALPGRPDLRDNLAGRMRAAYGWFSHLPPLMRRSILVKGLIGAAVAFVIGMGAVWAVEEGIGNSLSCGIWANCPQGATPGVHLGGGNNTGASSTLSLGRAKTQQAAPGYETQNRGYQQNQQAPPAQQVPPGYKQQPAPSNSRVQPGGGVFNEPNQHQGQQPKVPAKPASPSPESPAPGEEVPAGGAQPPADQQGASPAPSR